MVSKEDPSRYESQTGQLRAVVRGRVQGVGFRFFVLGEARRLGLIGGVWNRPDGAVELEARGSRAALAELLGCVRRGPALSRVDSVDEDWNAEFEAGTGFDVRR